MSYVSLGSFNYKINNKNINKQKLEKQAMILKFKLKLLIKTIENQKTSKIKVILKIFIHTYYSNMYKCSCNLDINPLTFPKHLKSKHHKHFINKNIINGSFLIKELNNINNDINELLK